jgi:hypothetical protein
LLAATQAALASVPPAAFGRKGCAAKYRPAKQGFRTVICANGSRCAPDDRLREIIQFE